MSLQTIESIEQSIEGPYDSLYRHCGFVWSNRPGRMVALAAKFAIPTRCLDVGCGDGKNLVFLENLGCQVDGIDISRKAISLAEQRRRDVLLEQPRGMLVHADARNHDFGTARYDLVICYGIYHCLNDEEILHVHHKVERSLAQGGYFAFAAFNNDLPLPQAHPTPGVILRARNHILDLTYDWEKLAYENGEVEEKHEPLIGVHKHALTWGLFRKPILI